MKKRLIGSLIAGIMILSLIGCGNEKDSKGEEVNKPVASEESNETEGEEGDKNNESLSPEEVKEEFARIKPELIKYFKENKIEYQEKSGTELNFEQQVEGMRLEGEIKGEKEIYLQIDLFFNGKKAGEGEVDIDLDKTMAPKVCDIVTGTNGKSYKTYYKEVNKIIKNKHSENPDNSIEKEFFFEEDHGKYIDNIGMPMRSIDGSMGIGIRSK